MRSSAAEKKLANGSLAAGQQFGYQYDGIGNREWAKSGGDSSGANLRATTYTPNALNQYTSIATPGSFDLLVKSPDTVSVSSNIGSAAMSRQGNLHRGLLTQAGANTSGTWVNLTISTDKSGDPILNGKHWLAPATVAPTYDDDGNLLTDGRWTYTWDGENRLLSMTTTSTAAGQGVPRRMLEFIYDYLSRRIGKKVSSSSDGSTWTVVSDDRYLYDGWNLAAEFRTSSGSPQMRKRYVWGLDLSGTLQGAGGVGGLLAVAGGGSYPPSHSPAYDGNGNIIAWLDGTGATVQRIDYDSFGNVLTREGDPSFDQPAFGFSTKYEDRETGLLYYGYRYYDPVTGRWPSKDPVGESGGANLYGFVANQPSGKYDYLGNSICVTTNS